MREVLFEFVPRGRHVKVSALDPQTFTEAVIVGDARQDVEVLKAVATRKLYYLLAKQRSARQDSKSKGKGKGKG